MLSEVFDPSFKKHIVKFWSSKKFIQNGTQNLFDLWEQQELKEVRDCSKEHIHVWPSACLSVRPRLWIFILLFYLSQEPHLQIKSNRETLNYEEIKIELLWLSQALCSSEEPEAFEECLWGLRGSAQQSLKATSHL